MYTSYLIALQYEFYRPDGYIRVAVIILDEYERCMVVELM